MQGAVCELLHLPLLPPSPHQPGRQQGADISTASAVWLLRGAAFEALENTPRAISCYKAALR